SDSQSQKPYSNNTASTSDNSTSNDSMQPEPTEMNNGYGEDTKSDNQTPQHSAPIESMNKPNNNVTSNPNKTVKSANKPMSNDSTKKDTANTKAKPYFDATSKKDIARHNTDFFKNSSTPKESIDTLQPENEQIDDFREDNDRLKSIFKRR
ncbi:MAG: hypothetical protein ACLUD1_10375, partial [Clostridia bacterium]